MDLSSLILTLRNKTGFPIFITRQQWLEDNKTGVVTITSFDDSLIIVDSQLEQHEISVESLIAIDWISASEKVLSKSEQDDKNRIAFVNNSIYNSMTPLDALKAHAERNLKKLTNKEK